MPWDRRPKVARGVSPPRVVATFPNEDATILTDMLDELVALHTVTGSSAKPDTAD